MMIDYFCRSITLGFFFSLDNPAVGLYEIADQLRSFGRTFGCVGDVPEWLGGNILPSSTSDSANSIGRF
jgi:hypothetical protein